MNLFSWLRPLRPGSSRPAHGRPPRYSAQLACEPLEDRALMSATLAIGDAYAFEGTGLVQFTVVLSAPSNQAVTVGYATADGSASGKSDYTATSGTLTFAAGETVKTISVKIKGDNRVEGTEAFQVSLTGAVGAAIADPLGIGYIYNSDSRGGDQHDPPHDRV